jgi:arylsulfatase A-like enzyme
VTTAPNILLITTDQHRFDALGCMGSSEVLTPNIDRLATQGVLFERCYVTNPVCMPSRASFLTGQFPDAHGVRRNGIPVPDVQHGLARALGRQGYRTGMFGKTHFAALRRDYAADYQFPDWRDGGDYFGFSERAITHDLKDYLSAVPTHTRARPAQPAPERAFVLDDYLDWMHAQHPEYYRLAVRQGLPEGQQPQAPELWSSDLPAGLHQSTWIADRTMAFIDQQREAPFFAWCSFVDPHHPFNAPRAYRERYDPVTFAPPLWEDGELEQRSRFHQDRHQQGFGPFSAHWREYRAQYYAMLSLIDDQVGRLLQHLSEKGLAENTLVVFTADHGEMLGDHGLARKGLFHYEPLIRVPLLLHWPGHFAAGSRQSGIVQTVDITATILATAGIVPDLPYQGLSLLPWCRGERHDAPRECALITNGGEGPHYDPWPELRTLVTERWKLQYYVGEQHIELDDLTEDPAELHPLPIQEHHDLVHRLLGQLVDTGSAASVRRRQVGRW